MDTIGYILEIHKNPRVLNVAQVGQVDESWLAINQPRAGVMIDTIPNTVYRLNTLTNNVYNILCIIIHPIAYYSYGTSEICMSCLTICALVRSCYFLLMLH